MKRIWIVLVMMSVAVANAFAQEQDENLIRKFLMEVPDPSNVEAGECWNEDLFQLLEQKNYIVADIIGTFDYDIQSRILEHLRNPIHDGIDVKKIYHDIKTSHPQAQSVINAVFDALRKKDISLLLNDKHRMRTVSYTSDDEKKMIYSDKTRKGARKHYPELQRVLDQLAYEDILDPQNDEIAVFAGISHLTGRIDEFVVRCNDGLYIAYAGRAICTPFRKIDAVEEFVKECRPQFYGETYQENECIVLNTFLSGNTENSISSIKKLGHPANYELYRQYLWKIGIENGKVISDELIVFDPLYLN